MTKPNKPIFLASLELETFMFFMGFQLDITFGGEVTTGFIF